MGLFKVCIVEVENAHFSNQLQLLISLLSITLAIHLAPLPIVSISFSVVVALSWCKTNHMFIAISALLKNEL